MNPNKKVGYNTPLTQTITTNKYVHSHIDLLAEEASPFTPTDPEQESTLETALIYTGDETKDGGQTPGPYEEMRRRMASLGDENVSAGAAKKDSLRKRKRREKKRQWIWTIGDNEEEEDEERMDTPVVEPIRQMDVDGTCSVPTTSSSRESSFSDERDSDMGEGEFVGSPHSI